MVQYFVDVVELAGIAYLIFLGHGIPTAVLNDLGNIFAPKTTTVTTVAPVVTTHTTTTSEAG